MANHVNVSKGEQEPLETLTARGLQQRINNLDPENDVERAAVLRALRQWFRATAGTYIERPIILLASDKVVHINIPQAEV